VVGQERFVINFDVILCKCNTIRSTDVNPKSIEKSSILEHAWEHVDWYLVTGIYAMFRGLTFSSNVRGIAYIHKAHDTCVYMCNGVYCKTTIFGGY